MSQADKKREIYQKRKAAGICTKCGKVPPVPGKTRCVECSNERKRYDAARKKYTKLKSIEKKRYTLSDYIREHPKPPEPERVSEAVIMRVDIDTKEVEGDWRRVWRGWVC